MCPFDASTLIQSLYENPSFETWEQLIVDLRLELSYENPSFETWEQPIIDLKLDLPKIPLLQEEKNLNE